MPTENMTEPLPSDADCATPLPVVSRDARAELAVLERYYNSLMDRLLRPDGPTLPRDEFESQERIARALEDRMAQFDCLEQQVDEMFDDFEPFSLFAELTR